jgi:hypothetical protein
MKSKRQTDPDLAESLRKMEGICIAILQMQGAGYNGPGGGINRKCKRVDLTALGMREFSLSGSDVAYCIGRARTFMHDMRELERARSRADLFRYGSAGRPRTVRAIDAGDGTWRIEELSPEANKLLAA